ncbi:MAG: insulinase family protein, partial [Bacteroidaceae bacterium]|nr:insulinase family protein [Bacteroidaceae bacterium]
GFGKESWGCGALSLPVETASPKPQPGRHIVPVPDTMQSAVKIGFMAMDTVHPDFYKFRFLCVLLGGYFGSRLMSNIREENGYTYHIAAELDAYGHRNAFMISSETATGYVEPLINEVYREIERLSNEPIEESEIELVRNYIMGELCREYEGQSAKSEVFINTWLSGADFESVNRYVDEIKSVTPAELQRLAREYFHKNRMIEIIAGA